MTVLGIDFGTTNTVASWLDERGELRMVPLGENLDTLPTVVSFMPGDSLLVGESALSRMLDSPAETVYGAKRFLGRRLLSEFVGRHRDRFSYELCEGEAGLVAAFVRGKVYALEDIAFAVLERVVELANIAAEVPFEECVLSVPAHFSYRQRSLLRQAAGRLLTVKAMVNEPTAAALSYAMHAPDDALLLVYDLGGGTFDATLLRIHDGAVGVLATGGDAFLGGLDFDEAIATFLAQRVAAQHGVDILADPVVSMRVRRAAEVAKITLSEDPVAQVRVPVVYSDGERFIDLDETLTRQEVNAVCSPLIERSVGLSEAILARGGISKDLLHGVVLVRGQTRMPLVRQRLAQVFSTVLSGARAVDPIRAVAEGGALLGAGASRLVDVLPLPIGVMTPGLSGETALPPNARLPAAGKLALPNRPAPGTSIKVGLYESVDITSIDREMIGAVEVPADWLEENGGDLTLHVAMSAGFALTASIEAATGGTLPLLLHGPGQQKPRAAAEATSAATFGEKTRTERRAPVQLAVHLRRPGAPTFFDAVATDVSSSGLFIETQHSFPAGSALQIEIDVGSWVAGTVEVMRVVDAAAHAQSGKPRGVGVRFVSLPEEARRFLNNLVEAQTDEISFDIDILDDDDEEKLTPAERLRRFLEAVAQQRLYAAVGIDDPLTPREEVAAAIRDLEQIVQDTLAQASPALRARLQQIEGVLRKLKKLFLNTPSRLRYDFRCGFIKAEQRLLAAQRGGPDVTALREAWHRTFPERVDQAALHQARAMQAAHGESWALALLEAEKALELEPFSLNLRLARKEWAAKATRG